MEVTTPTWIFFVIYCTQWLGVKQCVAVPIPTLVNHYYHSSKCNLNIKYRLSRHPEIYHDKFVFPNKDPLFEEKSEKTKPIKMDMGKIFFPDEAIITTTEKSYIITDVETGARPIWSIHYRPSTTTQSIESAKPELEPTKTETTSVDGSNQKYPLQLPNLDKPYQNAPPRTMLPLSSSKPTEPERVAVAVQEFYQWLRKSSPSMRKRRPTIQNSSVATPSITLSQSMIDSLHSEHSLVSGLKNQKCPDNQVRLANGQCKVKVDV